MTNLGNRDAADAFAFEIDGGTGNEFTGVVTVAGEIDNSTGAGHSVGVKNISQNGTSVTFSGDITDNGRGLLVDGNTGGTILFLGDVTANTETFTPIAVTNNTGSDVNFGGSTAP